MKRITAYRILGEMEDSKEMLYQLVDQVAYCECENYNRGKVLDFVSYLIANGVVVQKQGEWKKGDMPTYGGYKCSVCGKNTVVYKARYCPNCGAKMVKEDK